MKNNDVELAFESCREAPAVGSEDAGGMCLIDQQECIVPIRELHEVGQRRAVAIHAVDAFDRDPNSSATAALPPSTKALLCGLDIIVREFERLGSACTQALSHTRVRELIPQDDVALLRQG